MRRQCYDANCVCSALKYLKVLTKVEIQVCVGRSRPINVVAMLARGVRLRPPRVSSETTHLTMLASFLC